MIDDYMQNLYVDCFHFKLKNENEGSKTLLLKHFQMNWNDNNQKLQWHQLDAFCLIFNM